MKPFSARRYDFRPVTHDDLSMIGVWLHEPHVRRWWGSPTKERDLIRSGIDQPGVEGFVVSYDFVPFAYLQVWDPHFLGTLADQPPGARAIDPFIGVPSMLGEGHGGAIVTAVAQQLFEEAVPRVLADPDPANVQAIRAYERAGFSALGERREKHGTVLLMARDRIES